MRRAQIADKLQKISSTLGEGCGALRFGPKVRTVYNPLVYAARRHNRAAQERMSHWRRRIREETHRRSGGLIFHRPDTPPQPRESEGERRLGLGSDEDA